jgi:hypothetical protein
MIDRRTFVTGAASVAVAPALGALPAHFQSPEIATGRLVLMIVGWSLPEESGASDVAWMRIGHGWRTTWR